MINASTITIAVHSQLKRELDSSYTIERAEHINLNPDIHKWVGVYRGDMEYDVATLGSGLNSWKAIFEIKILVQASSMKSGTQAEERLESYLQEVLNAIMVDKTFSNAVAMTNGLSISYSYNRDESESLYFQMAEITLTTEVRTQ